MVSRPAVLFGDAAAWATTYLRAAIAARTEGYADDVTVRTQKPTATDTDLPPASGRVVTVRDDGGPRGPDVTKTVTLGVNVWAEDEGDCVDLANLTAALLEAAPGDGPVVAHVSTSGPFPLPDQSAKPHRYLSVDLSVVGSPL
jgi:hypothetical protein